MTARSRTWFWGLTFILALLLLFVGGLVGHRTWQVDTVRRAFQAPRACDIQVTFDFSGPEWLQPLLPQSVANAWFSTTSVMFANGDSRVDTDDEWQTALPLYRQLPSITKVQFRGGNVGSSTLQSLNEFPHLRDLILLECSINDQELESISQLTQLNTLVLSNNDVSDRGMASLASLKNLRRLYLDRTKVTDEGLSHLSGLKTLQVLNLDHTDLTEDCVGHLRSLTSLTDLSLVNSGLPDSALMSLEIELPDLLISDD